MKLLFTLFFLAISINGLEGQNNPNEILSLNEAIELGLKNNPDIKAAKEKIYASEGKFWSGISLPSPELSVSYEYVPTGQGLNNFSEKTIEINQVVEFPTHYFLLSSKLSIEKERAENEFKLTELRIVSKVKAAYYQVLSSQEQLQIAQENLTIAGDFYKKAEIRYTVGEGTNLEQLTAKVEYTEGINSVDIQKNRLTMAYAELNYMLGYGKFETREFVLTDKLHFTPIDFTFNRLIEKAVVNPQIKLDQLQVGSSSVERTLAWSSLLPNFNLAYFKQTRDGENGYYGALFGISIPLWFMFNQRGKIQEANANLSMAEYELQSTKNEIYLRIKKSFTEFKNKEKQIQLYQSEILPQSEEIYRTASKSYEAGEITYLELLQAQQTIIKSRGNYINALLSYHLSLISLEEAVGSRLQ